MERLEGSNVWDILFVCSRGRLAGQKKLGSCLSICGSPPARHPPQKHQVHWLMSETFDGMIAGVKITSFHVYLRC